MTGAGREQLLSLAAANSGGSGVNKLPGQSHKSEKKQQQMNMGTGNGILSKSNNNNNGPPVPHEVISLDD